MIECTSPKLRVVEIYSRKEKTSKYEESVLFWVDHEPRPIGNGVLVRQRFFCLLYGERCKDIVPGLEIRLLRGILKKLPGHNGNVVLIKEWEVWKKKYPVKKKIPTPF